MAASRLADVFSLSLTEYPRSSHLQERHLHRVPVCNAEVVENSAIHQSLWHKSRADSQKENGRPPCLQDCKCPLNYIPGLNWFLVWGHDMSRFTQAQILTIAKDAPVCWRVQTTGLFFIITLRSCLESGYPENLLTNWACWQRTLSTLNKTIIYLTSMASTATLNVGDPVTWAKPVASTFRSSCTGSEITLLKMARGALQGKMLHGQASTGSTIE